MNMHDCLTSFLPVVQPNVESSGMIFFRETGPDNGNKFPERLLYLSGEIEETCNVLSWDD